METRRAHRAVRIDPEKRRTKAKRSRSRVHTSICGGGVRTSAFSELVTASPGKIGLVNCLSLRLPFRRQRNVTSLLGRGEEPWVSCLSIVEHAIGESSRFVLLFLLFFFFFFFPLFLFLLLEEDQRHRSFCYLDYFTQFFSYFFLYFFFF